MHHSFQFSKQVPSPNVGLANKIASVAAEMVVLAQDLAATEAESKEGKRGTKATEPLALAKHYLKLRRQRERRSPGIFSDPAWDMLIELYVAHNMGQQMKITSLGALIGVPNTTCLRYLDLLVKAGHVTRGQDPHDRRRVWVSVTPMAHDMIDQWMSEMATIHHG